jgi:hypothetical protein
MHCFVKPPSHQPFKGQQKRNILKRVNSQGCELRVARSGKKTAFQRSTLNPQLSTQFVSRRLKSALSFFVNDYGLKSVAWGFLPAPSNIHATGFSQWLMTKFLSDEFIRRLRVVGGRTSW